MRAMAIVFRVLFFPFRVLFAAYKNKYARHFPQNRSADELWHWGK
jgi:hypothetical protein